MRPLTRDGALRARGAAIGVLALCLGAQLLAERAGGTLLRPLIFDGYQRALPRETGPVQVRVIDVDEESLCRQGGGQCEPAGDAGRQQTQGRVSTLQCGVVFHGLA